MMKLGFSLMAILDAASVLITTVTILTGELLVGVRQEVTIERSNTNSFDWLGKSLRLFVFYLLEL